MSLEMAFFVRLRPRRLKQRKDDNLPGAYKSVFVAQSLKLCHIEDLGFIDRARGRIIATVKPRCSAPAFNIIPLIKHTNFDSKKCFHNYLYVRENLGIKHNFYQSLEIRYSGV